MSRKPRYRLPTAREARRVLLAELGRHGFPDLAQRYVAREVGEKRLASLLGVRAEAFEVRGEAYRAKVARGVMLLAMALHEGKHNRPASADALRVFWSHMKRVHGGQPGRRGGRA